MKRRILGGAVAVLCGAATLVAAQAGPAAAAPGDITTVAGSNGDGSGTAVGQHVKAMAFAGPLLYLADDEQLVVRVLDTRNGQERVVAGNGYTGGYRPFGTGDGGPAINATFLSVDDVATDAAGNLYILDRGDAIVRRVDPGGTITTVAGVPRGCCALPPTFGGDGGPAKQARLGTPSSIAVDTAGNLFIADTGHYRIRKVTPSGTISTLAGDGSETGPVADARALTVDAAGNLSFTDVRGGTVRRVSPAGVVSHVAGVGETGFDGDGGPATAARISTGNLATDAAGNLYLASGRDWVRRIDSAGMIASLPKPSPDVVANALAVDALGQLGDGTKVDRNRPVDAVGLRGASDISGGALHTLAL